MACSILALENGCTPPEGQYKNDQEIIIYSDAAQTREINRKCINKVYTTHTVAGLIATPGVPYRGGGFPISVPNKKGELDLMIAEPRGRITMKEEFQLTADQTYQVIDHSSHCQ